MTTGPTWDFVLDADHLALDFLNTAVAGRPGAREQLVSPETTVAWLEAAGLAARSEVLRLASTPSQARLLHGEALRLRSAVAEAVAAFASGRPVPEQAVHGINRALGTHREVRRLVRDGAGLAQVILPVGGGNLDLLAPVAEAAAALLVEADPGRVRRCDADDCGRWFLDTSRNGSRRWCSMARCGNRAKVAAFYRRRRAGG